MKYRWKKPKSLARQEEELASSLDRAFNSKAGIGLLKAVDEYLRPPMAPTKSGYWFGFLTGEPSDPKLSGRLRPGIFTPEGK